MRKIGERLFLPKVFVYKSLLNHTSHSIVCIRGIVTWSSSPRLQRGWRQLSALKSLCQTSRKIRLLKRPASHPMPLK